MTFLAGGLFLCDCAWRFWWWSWRIESATLLLTSLLLGCQLYSVLA